MKILQERVCNVKRDGRAYCISHLYVDGKYECDAIEDYDRMLDSKMSISDIICKKISGQTAIPTGEYRIWLNVKSNKFGARPFYKSVCDGYLPRFDEVKGYTGVLIHCGNTELDSEGCVLVGYNKVVGKVINSQDAFRALYYKMQMANKRGEQIQYIITRKY